MTAPGPVAAFAVTLRTADARPERLTPLRPRGADPPPRALIEVRKLPLADTAPRFRRQEIALEPVRETATVPEAPPLLILRHSETGHQRGRKAVPFGTNSGFLLGCNWLAFC